MLGPDILAQAADVVSTCAAQSVRLVLAESCTGGLVAAALTAIPGSSTVVECGFVVYSNTAKTDQLGVPPALIEHYGAVSAEVAGAMAAGALRVSPADLALSVTGIAGPGGATSTKPVGLVFIGVARRDRPSTVERCQFSGDRAKIRAQTVQRALILIGTAAVNLPAPA